MGTKCNVRVRVTCPILWTRKIHFERLETYVSRARLSDNRDKVKLDIDPSSSSTSGVSEQLKQGGGGHCRTKEELIMENDTRPT